MDIILNFLGSIRWQEIVDIIINSYILFRLYIIFRGTNAFRVLIGIALLWIFQRIAASIGLIITSWAIQAITAAAAIIIIVVFRNEIRSVLQAKNIKSILWGIPHKKILTPIEIIVNSAFDLAEKHIGALIVFPAKEDIKELVQGGIPWHGIVSREMILSIFWRDNPVHDGAATINGKQITQVGVILPLSSRKGLPSDYGTRHRAALGLSEASDALVLVVSEEKGKVLVAKNAAMKTIGTEEELIQELRTHTGVATAPREFYKHEKFETSVVALASILFVISVWYSFFRGMETLITFQTPIDYMNRDANMEILATSVNTVNLDLSGSGPLIKSIRPEQVMVKIDLKEAVVGNNRFTLTKENITLPPGVLLKRVAPVTVDVVLDFPITKKLPIQVDWAGKLSRDLVLVHATLDPEYVEVVGRNQILKNVSTVYTQKVFLDDIKTTGTISVNMAFTPASLKPVPGTKEKVNISYIVRKRL